MDIGEAKEKVKDLRDIELDRSQINYRIFAVGLAMVVAIGTISIIYSNTENSSIETFGAETPVEYNTGQISERTASKVAEAVNESGWIGSSSKVRQLNESWYRINISTEMDPETDFTLNQQYKVQTTTTVLHHRAFNQSDTIIVNIKADDGTTISKFTQ